MVRTHAASIVLTSCCRVVFGRVLHSGCFGHLVLTARRIGRWRHLVFGRSKCLSWVLCKAHHAPNVVYRYVLMKGEAIPCRHALPMAALEVKIVARDVVERVEARWSKAGWKGQEVTESERVVGSFHCAGLHNVGMGAHCCSILPSLL